VLAREVAKELLALLVARGIVLAPMDSAAPGRKEEAWRGYENSTEFSERTSTGDDGDSSSSSRAAREILARLRVKAKRSR
jgi:hypothetical protein